MNDLTERYLKFIDYLIDNNEVGNTKDMAIKLGVSPSSITEIRKERTNVGISIIHKSVIEYNLNSNWIFTGVGNIIKKQIEDLYPDTDTCSYENIKTKRSRVSSPTATYTALPDYNNDSENITLPNCNCKSGKLSAEDVYHNLTSIIKRLQDNQDSNQQMIKSLQLNILHEKDQVGFFRKLYEKEIERNSSLQESVECLLKP